MILVSSVINTVFYELSLYLTQGQLTESEKKELLASIDRNIHELNDSLKDKKLPKIEEKLNSLIARKLIVEKINPIKYKLKFAEEILKSRVKIFPLIALEEKGRSMSLTLADLKLLGIFDLLEIGLTFNISNLYRGEIGVRRKYFKIGIC